MAARKLFSSISGLQLEVSSLERILRRAPVERYVLAAKILCGITAILCIVMIVREALAAKAKLTALALSLDNEVRSPSESIKLNTGSLSDYNILLRKPIFPADAVQAAPAATPKPASTTPLSLVGVYVADGETHYAIIEDQKKKIQDVFNIGEMIFGEANLLKIASDSVEIDRNGQHETLQLETNAPGKGDAKGGVAAVDDNYYVVDEGELEKSLENLPLLLTQARAVPYFKDGMPVGLRMFAIKSGSLYEKIGLKNGDILRSVNGNNLADMTQAMKLFETLKQERSVNLKLDRGSEEKEFRYEIR